MLLDNCNSLHRLEKGLRAQPEYTPSPLWPDDDYDDDYTDYD
jgi:hypothetical protein